MTHVRLLFGMPLVKGGLMGPATLVVVSSHLSDFAKALIIAAVSAVLSGGFLLVATVITVREARASRRIMSDVQRKVGAQRRTEDSPQ